MGVQTQHVHVRLPRQIDIRLELLFASGIKKKLGTVIGSAHEHRPPAYGKYPAFRSGLQPDVADAKCLPQACTLAFVGGDIQLRPIERRFAVGPGAPELRIRQGELHEHVLDIVAVQPEGSAHLQRCSDLKVMPRHPDGQFPGHDPAIEVAQPDAKGQPGQITLFEAGLAMHPFGDDMANLLEQHRPPKPHWHMPDVLLTETPELAAGVGLCVRVVEEAHQVALRRQVRLDGRLDADGQHVLLEQKRRNVKAKRREIAVVAAE